MSTLRVKRGLALSDNIEDYPEGLIFPIDKPYRWTSADVIRKIKWAACRHFHDKKLKVGHAGTLDPLATGVLLVCIGKATKSAEELQRHDKEYLAGVLFGATTPSYDREKDIDRRYPVGNVSKERVAKVLEEFIGEQEQVAPLFSAKSVDGVRAYELARREYKLSKGTGFDHSGEELLSKQMINVPKLELIAFYDSPHESEQAVSQENRFNDRINVIDTSSLKLPQADILVECSKGTYIRALARDIGEALDSGAFLNSLRRTATGDFRVEDCLDIEEAMAILGHTA